MAARTGSVTPSDDVPLESALAPSRLEVRSDDLSTNGAPRRSRIESRSDLSTQDPGPSPSPLEPARSPEKQPFPLIDLSRLESSAELLELETRIRTFVLDMIQPHLRKVGVIEHDVDELASDVRDTTLALNKLERSIMKLEQQETLVQGFKTELAQWDAERRHAEATTSEELTIMRQDLDTHRYNMERQDTANLSLRRSVERATGQVKEIQNGLDSLQSSMSDRTGMLSKMLNSSKTDLEAKLMALESKHLRLCDEFFSEESGLARVVGRLEQTRQVLDQTREELSRVQLEMATKVQMSALQDETALRTRDALTSIASVRETVDAFMTEIKEHFHTATETMATHSARMIDEARAGIQEELSSTRELRMEVEDLTKEARDRVLSIEQQVERCSSDTSAGLNLMQKHEDKASKLRKSDRDEVKVELGTLRQKLSTILSNSGAEIHRLEQLSSAVSILVESQRVACALSLQDDTDRNQVALMAYRDSSDAEGASSGGSRRPSSSSSKDGGVGGGRREATPSFLPGSTVLTAPADLRRPGGRSAKSAACAARQATTTSGRSTPRGDAAGAAGGTTEPVITVDQRCMSCNGHPESVFAAFKMACLQYTPGPVSYQKGVYSRRDLLDLQSSLVNEALESLTKPSDKKDRSRQRESQAVSRKQSQADSRSGSVYSVHGIPPMLAGLPALMPALTETSEAGGEPAGGMAERT